MNKPKIDLRDYINPQQGHVTRQLCRGEEGQFFKDKLNELADIIAAMPKIGETDDNPDALFRLHYFTGSANWWISEIGENSEAFGYAALFGGPNDQDAEYGYISIPEILAAGAELDYHFSPVTLAQLKEQA